ncbi:hypothetical protein J6590_067850 [Homalodisca vitripennis]|nr:hypothetical protein J6590_067850 [Homalodisca vitripennis]
MPEITYTKRTSEASDTGTQEWLREVTLKPLIEIERIYVAKMGTNGTAIHSKSREGRSSSDNIVSHFACVKVTSGETLGKPLYLFCELCSIA